MINMACVSGMIWCKYEYPTDIHSSIYLFDGKNIYMINMKEEEETQQDQLPFLCASKM